MRKIYDVVIAGGGVNGLLVAYRLAKEQKSVLVVEKSTIGNWLAASSGITRSLRNDYKDPRYSVLARKSWDLWLELEKELKTDLVVRAGCLNICDDALDDEPYARQSREWLKRDKNPFKEYPAPSDLKRDFEQFEGIDYAVLDQEAGMCLASAALRRLREELGKSDFVDVVENESTKKVAATGEGLRIELSGGREVRASKLLVAAGLGTPEVVDQIDTAEVQFSLQPDRPVECLYYRPANPEKFTADTFPVIANLDVGIYGHPIVPGVTDAFKIGMYAPPQIVNELAPDSVYGVKEFVEQYLPELAKSSEIEPVVDADQCSYDLTSDGDFVIGEVPGAENVVVAAGFNGTGFKFAPAVAEIMCELINDRKPSADISAFGLERFKSDKGVSS